MIEVEINHEGKGLAKLTAQDVFITRHFVCAYIEDMRKIGDEVTIMGDKGTHTIKMEHAKILVDGESVSPFDIEDVIIDKMFIWL